MVLVRSHHVDSVIGGTPTLTATVTIARDPAWIAEHECGQKCVWINSGHIGAEAHPDIVLFIDCSLPYLNACLCRSDLGVAVTSFLSSCVSSRCNAASIPNTAAEITTAVSIYNQYCLTAAGVAFPSIASDLASNQVQTSSTRSSQISSGTLLSSGATITTPPTSNTAVTVVSGNSAAANTGSSPNSSGLAQSDKIALGVGLGMGLPSILLAVMTYVGFRRRHNNMGEAGNSHN
jgi:hypothetical protein